MHWLGVVIVIVNVTVSVVANKDPTGEVEVAEEVDETEDVVDPMVDSEVDSISGIPARRLA